jgi:CrcB protein
MRDMAWIAIAVGGALGSMARHAVNQLADGRFPAGTVIVNLLGSLVIGLLAGMLAGNRIAMPAQWRQFVFVGLLGGFTTFSTFALETLVLARTQPAAYAVVNVGLQVAGGLAAVWAGYRLGLGT